MAVRIYRWRAPELTVTLTAGGTLAANTKYYITSYFNMAWIYNNANSIFAVVKDFTTTDTNKSISLYWKVTVPIQGFESGGTGKIRVKATNHCITDTNTIIIEDGIYAGTYVVQTWENYNSFLINGTYSSDYTSTFRVETMHNAASGMIVYMHTTAPFSGDPTKGTWQGNFYGFSHYPWTNGYTTNNIAIIAPCTLRMYGVLPQIQGTYYPPAPWCKVMEKGKIWMNTSGAATVAEIKQACIDADVTDIAYFMGTTFVIYGILRSLGTLSFTDMNINCYWGMIGGGDTFTQITYLRCNVQLHETCYGSYLAATATNSNFMFESKDPIMSGYVYKYPIGTNNVFNSVLGLGAEGMENNFTVSGMTVNSVGGSWRIHCKSTTSFYINCKLINDYVNIYYVNASQTGHYMLDGFTFENNSVAYDFSVYNLAYDLFLRNVDTNRTNNRKVVYTSYVETGKSIYFYRTGTITVKDSAGIPIPNAPVSLTDDHGNVYNYTTNPDGIITYNVIEQKSTDKMAIGYFTDTFYENWIIIVTKANFIDYTGFFKLAKDIDDCITMLPPVYVDRHISGKIATKMLTGSIGI